MYVLIEIIHNVQLLHAGRLQTHLSEIDGRRAHDDLMVLLWRQDLPTVGFLLLCHGNGVEAAAAGTGAGFELAVGQLLGAEHAAVLVSRAWG